MKNIGVYGYNQDALKQLEEILLLENIKLIALENNNKREDIELYIFNIDTPEEFEKIDFDMPFLIISSLNASSYLLNSKKIGAKDYILKPFIDINSISKRIQRAMKQNTDSNSKATIMRTENNNKLIDIEIKRAHRGKYPVALLLVKIQKHLSEQELIRIIDKMKLALRDSDSCLLYPDQNIIVMLPFADKEGTIFVSRKIFDLLNDLGYKNYCLGAQYPEEGDIREELINNLGNTIDTRTLYK